MRAITVIPGQANSAALTDMPEPDASEGSILVQALSLGICGTDVEIVAGEYGWLPAGQERLILGHESFGRVLEAPAGAPVKVGDLVVGIVRRPDAVPCAACGADEWDMCLNGQYTERGIKQRHGFGSERFRIEPEFVIKIDASLKEVGVLLEPTTVLAKAWDHIEKIGQRAFWQPKTVLVTGAGPIGLLAALMGRQRGLEVHVLDRVADGLKPRLVHELGATYHTGAIKDIGVAPDIILECTGVPQLIVDGADALACSGIMCLAGVSPADRHVDLDLGSLNRKMVLQNEVIFGSVNANRHHFELAVEALLKADKDWLKKLISRREPVENWQAALQRQPDDIKVVIDFAT